MKHPRAGVYLLPGPETIDHRRGLKTLASPMVADSVLQGTEQKK